VDRYDQLEQVLPPKGQIASLRGMHYSLSHIGSGKMLVSLQEKHEILCEFPFWILR
jgi:hypothetical protein